MLRDGYGHHLSIARGSLTEPEALVETTDPLNYFRRDDLSAAHELIDHAGRMLTRLLATLRS